MTMSVGGLFPKGRSGVAHFLSDRPRLNLFVRAKKTLAPALDSLK
jgi:hypothetical protein